MRRPTLIFGALAGALTSFPLIALFYLGNRLLGLPFLPFDLFDWTARVLPGDLVTFGIDTIVELIRTLNLGPTSETAKFVEQLMALIAVVVGGALFGLLIAFIIQRRGAEEVELDGVRIGAQAGIAVFAISAIVELWLGFSGNALLVLGWVALLTIGWGAVLGATLAATVQPDEVPADQSRRSLLLQLVGGSLGLTLAGWGLGRWLGQNQAEVAVESGASQPLPATPSVPAVATLEVDERLEPAPGTRPELTSNEAFYRIDINTRPPVIDGDSWQLELAGLFENSEPLTIDDLMAYPAVTQPITLSCISNRIAGDLIGTSFWTGVRLRDVLADLGLQPEAGALFLEAEDGFYETVVAEDMMDERTLLVYGMNGETLPIEHGYPLRIYIPNRYGMKQPKWIRRMEAIEAWAPGYWVERGWSREARPHIVSVIDTIALEAIDDGMLPIGGIAWAGDRGIQKVEVQVDDGPWQEAQLRTPPLSGLTWVQWRYDWPADEGRHRFTVRAVDGNGDLQIAEETGVRPDGATGYHSVEETI